jgi:hypothetical protein
VTAVVTLVTVNGSVSAMSGSFQQAAVTAYSPAVACTGIVTRTANVPEGTSVSTSLPQRS